MFPVPSEMEEESFGKFSYQAIFNYLKDGTYPGEFTKAEKGSLRKRAKYFFIKEADLFYKGKSTGKIHTRFCYSWG